MTEEFCLQFPDDVICQEEPEDPFAFLDDENGDEEVDHGEFKPVLGNLTYLIVPLFSTLFTGLELFRFHADSDYDNGTVMGSANPWLRTVKWHLNTHFTFMFLLTCS